MPPQQPFAEHLLSRRQVLAGMAAGTAVAAAGPLLAPPAYAAVSVEEFLELSAVLTDDVADLPEQAGRRYLEFLRADPDHAGPLERLVDAGVRGDDPLRTFAALERTGVLDDRRNALTSQRILELWYSGLVDGETATYLEALAWTTLEDFAEPTTVEIGFSKWDERP